MTLLLRIGASRAREGAAPLLWFAYLQLLDLLSTISFLLDGVAEGNPIVSSLIELSGNAFTGLLWAKIIALALAFVCWKTGRSRALAAANVGYALLIVWNFIALILVRTV